MADVARRALEPFYDADRPYGFTKTGPERLEDGESHMHGDAAFLRAETEASLRRLGVERLDLLQVNWPPVDGSAVDDYRATLAALRDEGKLARIDLSNPDVDQLAAPRRSTAGAPRPPSCSTAATSTPRPRRSAPWAPAPDGSVPDGRASGPARERVVRRAPAQAGSRGSCTRSRIADAASSSGAACASSSAATRCW